MFRPTPTPVVIAGPTGPFNEDEVNALVGVRRKGGDLMIMVDPGVDSGLGPLASRWGVQANKAFVVEA